MSVPGFSDTRDEPGSAITNLQLFGGHSYSEFSDATKEVVVNESVAQVFLFDDFDASDSFPELYDPTVGELTTSHLKSANNAGFLARLCTAEYLPQQSADLVMEALCAIPEQMLRRATFPPFIHPHWHRPSLPEPLAICTQIAYIFASRTPEIRPFIWRTILAEQQRTLDQVCTLGPIPYTLD